MAPIRSLAYAFVREAGVRMDHSFAATTGARIGSWSQGAPDYTVGLPTRRTTAQRRTGVVAGEGGPIPARLAVRIVPSRQRAPSRCLDACSSSDAVQELVARTAAFVEAKRLSVAKPAAEALRGDTLPSKHSGAFPWQYL